MGSSIINLKQDTSCVAHSWLLELEKIIQFPTKSHSTNLLFILPNFATSFNIASHTCIYANMHHLWSSPLWSSAVSTTLPIVSRLCVPEVQFVSIGPSYCPGHMCLSRWTGFFQHLGGPEVKARSHRTLQSVKQPESSIFDHLRKRSLSCSFWTCVYASECFCVDAQYMVFAWFSAGTIFGKHPASPLWPLWTSRSLLHDGLWELSKQYICFSLGG